MFYSPQDSSPRDGRADADDQRAQAGRRREIDCTERADSRARASSATARGRGVRDPERWNRDDRYHG